MPLIVGGPDRWRRSRARWPHTARLLVAQRNADVEDPSAADLTGSGW
jgi:hypothetical protein